MAETAVKKLEGNSPARSSVAITSWWKKFHFSGRVIMCSVLFGFGLVLVGSIIFAINMNDDKPKLEDNSFPNEMPPKAPSNVVGPVVIGIGSFIVIVGIVMCLFETQVCRKKTGDSSPLISERQKDSESTSVPSTSQGHRQGIRKAGTSPKRFKERHAKCHSKDKNQQKTPSPPIDIESSRNFMTSSEENFLTPPSTITEHTALVHSNSRDVDSQTTGSLMKSFASSGPSWSQSTEFQTPSTSFRDTSVSINNSIEICKNQDMMINPESKLKKNLDEGFLTPVTLEGEVMEKMASHTQHHTNEVSEVQSISNVYLPGHEKDDFSDKSVAVKEQKNMNEMPLQPQTTDIDKYNQESGNKENKNTSTDQQKLSLSSEKTEGFVEECHEEAAVAPIISVDDLQKVVNSPTEKFISVDNEDIMAGKIAPVKDNHSIISEDTQGDKLDSEEKVTKDNLEDNNDRNSSTTNTDESISEKVISAPQDNHSDQNDLESAVSSDETVMIQGSVVETPLNKDASEKSTSEFEKTNETSVINIPESENMDSEKSQSENPIVYESKGTDSIENTEKETSDSR